jgi:hypothetical protein
MQATSPELRSIAITQFRLIKNRGNVRTYRDQWWFRPWANEYGDVLDDAFMKHLRGETKNG